MPIDSPPLPALLKRFALIYLPIATVISIALLLGVRHDEQDRVSKLEVREHIRIAIAKERILKDFNAVEADLRVIVHLPLLRRYLDSGKSAQREELEKLFLLLSQETGHYDKVRYLDASGQEVIRINYNNGKPAVVPHELMQNKGGRYFFLDAIKLNADEIYVSPLDLNVEQNRLEIPHKPAIRFGTPVFDSAGNKKGIILLNYFGDELRQNFRDVMKDDDQRSSMLLNRDGYWLNSDKREDEWGFMLGKGERTFGHDFPAAWRAISAADQGTLLTEQGLFSYTTVYPLLPGQHSSTGSSVINAPSQKELLEREFHWKIVSFIPHEFLSGAAFYNQPDGRIVLAVAYLLLALAAWIVASITLSRKQAEQALVAGEKFRAIFENAQDGMLLADAQTRQFLMGNSALCLMLGYSPEEIMQLGVADIHPQQALPYVVEQFERQLRGEIQLAADIPVKRKDGSVFYADIKSSLVNLGGKNCLMGIFRDITERKRMEELLRKSNERFDLAVKGTNDGIWDWDIETNTNYFSPRFLELLGYGPDETEHKLATFESFLHPEDRGWVFDKVRQHLEDKIPYNVEYRMRTKNGEYRWFQARGEAVRDQSGNPYRMAGSITDITERKRYENEVWSIKANLEAALASMSDAVFISDSEGRFTHFNDAFATFHKFRNKEECAKTLGEYPEFLDVYSTSGELVPLEQWAVPRALRGETGASVEFTLKRKDTGETWIGSYNYAPIRDKDGMIVGSVVTARNITERKQAEAKLAEYVEELRRWHEAMKGRELRTLELKREINELLREVGQPPRYLSVVANK